MVQLAISPAQIVKFLTSTVSECSVGAIGFFAWQC
jgi:hypothetical protein